VLSIVLLYDCVLLPHSKSLGGWKDRALAVADQYHSAMAVDELTEPVRCLCKAGL
jgi:hypothetical protein